MFPRGSFTVDFSANYMKVKRLCDFHAFTLCLLYQCIGEHCLFTGAGEVPKAISVIGRFFVTNVSGEGYRYNCQIQ